MRYLKTYESFEQPMSSSEAESKLKDPKFLEKKRELIEYLTKKDNYSVPRWSAMNQKLQLEFDMTSKEPKLADITGDGVMDTEMMTFKKLDLVIHSGVTYYSNGDVKYITTVRDNSGEVILEPFVSKDIEELDRTLRPFFNSVNR